MSILTVTFVTEAPNTIIRSSRWNTDFTDITTFVNNKNMDSTDNIADGGVSTAAIANLAVTDAKIAGITSSGKVNGSALTSLSSTPSGAGQLPAVNGGVPSGGIIMWSGTIATIPSGYFLCNGSNGTPDLRNRFIVCADADSGGAAKSTVSGAAAQTGGSATKDVSHLHTVPKAGWGTTVSDVGNGTIRTTVTGSAENHATADNNSGTSGSATQDVLNPYYALAYIMKS